VVVQQQNREAVDVQDLEHYLRDFLEQRRHVRRARERLRDLQQQCKLLTNALLVRHDDRGLIHHDLRPTRAQRFGERLPRIRHRALPDDGRCVPSAVAVAAVLRDVDVADVERELAEREHVPGGYARMFDTLAVHERPVARSEVVQLDPGLIGDERCVPARHGGV
jgi:hypothetical protein